MAKASTDGKTGLRRFCDAKISWHLQVVGKKLGICFYFPVFLNFTGLGAHITATLIFHALKFLPEVGKDGSKLDSRSSKFNYSNASIRCLPVYPPLN